MLLSRSSKESWSQVSFHQPKILDDPCYRLWHLQVVQRPLPLVPHLVQVVVVVVHLLLRMLVQVVALA